MKSAIVLAMFVAVGLSANGETIMYLDAITPNTATVGSDFSFDVDLYGPSQDVAAFNFSVFYPVTLLQATDVVEEGFFSTQGCCFGFSIDNENGVISGISDAVFGNPPDNVSLSEPDTLVSIQFQALASGLATIQLGCSQGDTSPCATYPLLTDSNSNSIPTIIGGADIAVTPDSVSAPEPKPAVPLTLLLLIGGVAARLRRKRLAIHP